MLALRRPGRAICAVLVSAGAAASAPGLAQSPIDVPTLVTIAPQDEAPAADAPRSSFDHETARTAGATPPWEQPAPRTAQGGAVAAVPAAPAPSPLTAFTGAALPLVCRHAGYRVIIDERSDLRSGTLCLLPDGSWQLLP